MKVLVYDPNGNEFFYEFKNDIPYQSHITHLFRNLLEYSIGKDLARLTETSIEVLASHYSLQDSKTAKWLESSSDPIISEQSILFYKLKPLTPYISTIEQGLKKLNGNGGNNNSTTLSIREHIELLCVANNGDEIESRLNSDIQSLDTHIKLLWIHEKKKSESISSPTTTPSTTPTSSTTTTPSTPLNSSTCSTPSLAISSSSHGSGGSNLIIGGDSINRIIKIIYQYPTLPSLSVLVDYLSAINQDQLHNVHDLLSVLSLDTNNNNNNVLLNGGNMNNINHNNNNGVSGGSSIMMNSPGDISLFTMVDQSIKTNQLEFKSNFYLVLLNNQQNLNQVGVEHVEEVGIEEEEKLEKERIAVQLKLISFINNMYLLSSNPVNYLTKLHTDGIFKAINELIICNSIKITNSKEFKFLRTNLMKELYQQRNQLIDTTKINIQTMLSDLWNATLSTYPFRIKSHRWLLLGFRGTNPIDDFRVTGLLALRNLSYFAKHHTSTLQYLLMTQTRRETLSNALESKSTTTTEMDETNSSSESPCVTPRANTGGGDDTEEQPKSYPFATIGISITHTLSSLFKIPSGLSKSSSHEDSLQSSVVTPQQQQQSNVDQPLWDISISSNKWFDECYVYTLFLFESLWNSKAYIYSDFPQIMTFTKQIIEHIIKHSPKSSLEFRDMIVMILEGHEPLNIGLELNDLMILKFKHLEFLSDLNQPTNVPVAVESLATTTTTSTTSTTTTTTTSTTPPLSQEDQEEEEKRRRKMEEKVYDFSCQKLTKFFGERVDPRIDSHAFQFAPQPSNVSITKLRDFFGDTVTPGGQSNSNNNSTNNTTTIVPMAEEDFEEECERLRKKAVEKRNHRLHVFFGEWFETEQVEYTERIRSTQMYKESDYIDTSTNSKTSKSPTSPTSPSSNTSASSTSLQQPDNIRINKLNKFFGIRVPISKDTMRLEHNIHYYDDGDDDDDDGSPRHHDDNIETRSPEEEIKSNFKAQKVLGERINIKKEREAVNFAPQPTHIREHKLHKLFGEMVPTQKQSKEKEKEKEKEPKETKERSSSMWRKGTSAGQSKYHSSVIIPLATTPPQSQQPIPQPQPQPTQTISSTPPQQKQQQQQTPPVVPPIAIVPFIDINSSDEPLPLPKSPHVNNNQQPSSCRASLNSSIAQVGDLDHFEDSQDDDDLQFEESEEKNREKERKEEEKKDAFEEEDDEDESDDEESNRVTMSRRKSSAHRLQVFFGERFDVEQTIYNQKFLSPADMYQNVSVSPQPDNVKDYKLKKKFGKSAVDMVDNKGRPILTSSGDNNFTTNQSNQSNSNSNSNSGNSSNNNSNPTSPRDRERERERGSSIGEKLSPRGKVGKVINIFNSHLLKDRSDSLLSSSPQQSPSSSSFKSTSLPSSPSINKKYSTMSPSSFGINSNSNNNETSPSSPSSSSSANNSIVVVNPLSLSSSSIHSTDGANLPVIHSTSNNTNHTSNVSPNRRKSNSIIGNNFKVQKLLGERLDVSKESTRVTFKDQPSNIKVDKLISIFGEKVSFSLKRTQSAQSLLSSSLN
ncbi:engulfment and cell motility ELM family protein [Cavenderia fasciculata]|uniref:Engulfment and cell motility ELM family protein n=1 Tax=Cavenderia fasciculata TaxID=261658 RepID=F4Q9Z3_CACFS|nr:engulfment and cell motility ELM family protein [Cavenderia fasciculata]EGG15512.1 engulfment and cell motility ELM family protein [Cavenderia fasciculata]|eukprot:XP_004354254.1 engulfment and cell motility ELM family protein [Cavenderia fasciculata]